MDLIMDHHYDGGGNVSCILEFCRQGSVNVALY